jgi:hypothetical protein
MNRVPGFDFNAEQTGGADRYRRLREGAQSADVDRARRADERETKKAPEFYE